MKINKLFGIILFSLLLLPSYTTATSGACSSHGGVNCSAGSDSDGSVICNDGWSESSTLYSNTATCRDDKISCPSYLKDDDYQKMKNEIEVSISTDKSNSERLCTNSFNDFEALNEKSYQNCKTYNSTISTNAMVSGRSTPTFLTQDCETAKTAKTQENINNKNNCISTSNGRLSKYESLLACIHPESEQRAKMMSACSAMILNSTYDASSNSCECRAGEILSGKRCVNFVDNCKIRYGNNADSKDNLTCSCIEGFHIENNICSPDLKTEVIVKNNNEAIERSKKSQVNQKTSDTKITTEYKKVITSGTESEQKKSSTISTSSSILSTATTTKVVIPPSSPWYKKVWKFIWRF